MMYECGGCGNSSNVIFIDPKLVEKYKGKSDFGINSQEKIYCLRCGNSDSIIKMDQEELSCIRRVKK